MTNVSRRNFLITTGASAASTVFLHGCFGNPPGISGLTEKVEALEISPEQKPEATTIKLGYLPILESAPLIIAQYKGFFAKYGMKDVIVSKQAKSHQ
jgi:bicarbonate transport system substrate-binding protein